MTARNHDLECVVYLVMTPSSAALCRLQGPTGLASRSIHVTALRRWNYGIAITICMLLKWTPFRIHDLFLTSCLHRSHCFRFLSSYHGHCEFFLSYERADFLPAPHSTWLANNGRVLGRSHRPSSVTRNSRARFRRWKLQKTKALYAHNAAHYGRGSRRCANAQPGSKCVICERDRHIACGPAI